MAANTTTKVLTKCVDIRGEKFVLIELTRIDNGKKYFGTVPYTELDEKGCMKREMNGLELCMNETVGRALEMRENEIATRGMSEKEMLSYFMKKLAR